MAQVPASYIKDKAVDFEAEIFACAGVPRTFCGIEVLPPPVGVFALLEILDNRFVGSPATATVRDFTEALYVTHRRELAAAAVQSWQVGKGERLAFDVDDKATWTPWDHEVVKFAARIDGKFQPEDMAAFSDWLMGPTFGGYEMIPPSSSGGVYVFGAEAIAGCVARGHGSAFEAIWRTPLCLSGFIAANEARSAGTKGVGRPKDPADIKAQCDAAVVREAAGELHPWQIAEPDYYGLEPAQVQARPAVSGEFAAILKAHLRKKRGEVKS